MLGSYNPNSNFWSNALCANVATSRYWSVITNFFWTGYTLISFGWSSGEQYLTDISVSKPEGMEVLPAFSIVLLFTGSSIEIRDQDSLNLIT